MAAQINLLQYTHTDEIWIKNMMFTQRQEKYRFIKNISIEQVTLTKICKHECMSYLSKVFAFTDHEE